MTRANHVGNCSPLMLSDQWLSESGFTTDADSEPTRLKGGVSSGRAQDLFFMWCFPVGRTSSAWRSY